MNRLIPIEIEGKKLVQLSQLTIDQANDLRSWLPSEGIKQVNLHGMELQDCVDCETYDYWFKSYQNSKRVTKKSGIFRSIQRFFFFLQNIVQGYCRVHFPRAEPQLRSILYFLVQS